MEAQISSTTYIPERMLLTSIDTIMELFKDYCSQEDLPDDAMPITLLFNKNEKGRFCIVAVSDDWQQDLPPLEVKFDLKRIYSV